MARSREKLTESRGDARSQMRLSGNVIISELLRNMEVGRFEMAYTVLLPCVFTVYLNPEDHGALKGVFPHVIEDARRALRERVTELNAAPGLLSVRRHTKASKEHKIAGPDWSIEFFPDSEVPRGDVEIHSELNESVEAGFRGAKTTLLEREPSVTSGTRTNLIPSDAPKTVASQTVANQTADRAVADQVVASHVVANHLNANRAPDTVYAEIHYEDDSGPQVFLMTQNQIRIGRGGNGLSVDLALYTNDEVSREHLSLRRDAASGAFFISDSSTNGTSVNGKRLRKASEEALPPKADIRIGNVLTLAFEVRK